MPGAFEQSRFRRAAARTRATSIGPHQLRRGTSSQCTLASERGEGRRGQAATRPRRAAIHRTHPWLQTSVAGTSTGITDIWALSDLCTPWCVHVVATLRVAHHIDAGHRQIGISRTRLADRDALHRLLRHLSRERVFEEPARRTFALNDAARPLLDEGLLVGFDLDSVGGRMAPPGTACSPRFEPDGRPITRSSPPVLGRSAGTSGDRRAIRCPAGAGRHGVPDPESCCPVTGPGCGTFRRRRRHRDAARRSASDPPRRGAEPWSTSRRRSRAPPGRSKTPGVADRVTMRHRASSIAPCRRRSLLLKSVLSDWPSPGGRDPRAVCRSRPYSPDASSSSTA